MLCPPRDPHADLLDTDGRPIGEIASARYVADATEVVACPYPDGRLGGPMNRTALRQVSACWPSVIRAASTLATGAGADGTTHAAWWASVAGILAPEMHHRRYGTPVPAVLSALYKSCLGMSQVLTALLLAEDGVADAPLADLGDADAFADFLDTEGWLIGEEQVCAGPSAHIPRPPGSR